MISFLFIYLESDSICHDISSNSSSVSTSVSVEVQTKSFQTITSHTPRKTLLRAQLRAKTQQCKEYEKTIASLTNQLNAQNSIDNFIKQCDVCLAPNLSTIVKTYIQNCARTPQGMRYSKQLKQLALTIHFMGPKVYKFLQSFLKLPTPRTLRKITSSYELISGINDFMFDFLSFKIKNFNEDAKQCILCIDEMALKTHLFYNISKDEIIGFHAKNKNKSYEPAKYALVIMLRGINSNWKQIIAYYFVSSSCPSFELMDIMYTVIRRAESIGFDINAVVSDQGSNFLMFARTLGVSVDRPYFKIDGKNIVYMFDPPHLLKSTRNMFFKHNLQINEKQTDKVYLEKFYNADKQKLNRCAYKLTDIHIYPNSFQKMKVRYAAQVFSSTVAASMETYKSLGLLPDSSLITIMFISDMDKLFDIFNSRRKGGSKAYNRPFINSIDQKNHLLKMLNIFKNLIVFDKKGNNVTNCMNFSKGWQISIAGLFYLWDTLKLKNSAKSRVLYTNRINQDCLENAFGSFRKNGNNVNPTPYQFSCTFKKHFCLDYFQHSDGANCLEDLDQILSHINNSHMPLTEFDFFNSEKTPFKFTGLKIGTTDYRNLTLPNQNSLSYICGYFIKKCLERHTCEECIVYAKHQKKIDQSFYFSHFKAYQNSSNSVYGNLNMPHESFYNFINQLDNIFLDNFPRVSVEKNVGRKLKDYFLNVPFQHPCQNFDLMFLINLYTRCRIFNAVDKHNKNLMSVKNLKNRKLTILTHL